MHIISKNRSLRVRSVQQLQKDYRRSLFCIPQETVEGMLLCNAATGEMILLTDEEYWQLCSGNLPSSDWVRELAERFFLVPSADKETEFVDQLRKQEQDKRREGEILTSFTILPTSRCNARCFYCYEQGIPQKNMTRKTAEDVADFIARSSKGQSVHLGWFGGEPTLAHPTISLICQRLREKQVEFRSGMISNGFLLDEALIETGKEQWKLRHIQITIDGTEAVYNKTKDYKGNPENPFQTVLSHVECLLAAEIRVSVRINLGTHNCEDVNLLIEQLGQRFRGKEGFSAYVHEIDNYYTTEAYLALTEQTAAFNQKLVQMGFHEGQTLPSLRLFSCMADKDDSVVINPDGQLGKCEHYVFEKLHGSIYDDYQEEQLKQDWKQKASFPQCSSCPMYAACLRLQWCNGGNYLCSDGIIQGKLNQVKNTMLQMYGRWQQQRQRLRKACTLRLSCNYSVTQTEGEVYAEFLTDAGEVAAKVPVNQTAVDILTVLQKPCRFWDIVDMLEEKYDAAGDSLENMVEEYILTLIQENLCNVSR